MIQIARSLNSQWAVAVSRLARLRGERRGNLAPSDLDRRNLKADFDRHYRDTLASGFRALDDLRRAGAVKAIDDGQAHYLSPWKTPH